MLDILSILVKANLKIFFMRPEPKLFKPPCDICCKNYTVSARFSKPFSEGMGTFWEIQCHPNNPDIALVSHESLG